MARNLRRWPFVLEIRSTGAGATTVETGGSRLLGAFLAIACAFLPFLVVAGRHGAPKVRASSLPGYSGFEGVPESAAVPVAAAMLLLTIVALALAHRRTVTFDGERVTRTLTVFGLPVHRSSFSREDIQSVSLLSTPSTVVLNIVRTASGEETTLLTAKNTAGCAPKLHALLEQGDWPVSRDDSARN